MSVTLWVLVAVLLGIGFGLVVGYLFWGTEDEPRLPDVPAEDDW